MHYKLPKNGQRSCWVSMTQVRHKERRYDLLEIQRDFVRTRQYGLLVNGCDDGPFGRIFTVTFDNVIAPFQKFMNLKSFIRAADLP